MSSLPLVWTTSEPVERIDNSENRMSNSRRSHFIQASLSALSGFLGGDYYYHFLNHLLLGSDAIHEYLAKELGGEERRFVAKGAEIRLIHFMNEDKVDKLWDVQAVDPRPDGSAKVHYLRIKDLKLLNLLRKSDQSATGDFYMKCMGAIEDVHRRRLRLSEVPPNVSAMMELNGNHAVSEPVLSSLLKPHHNLITQQLVFALDDKDGDIMFGLSPAQGYCDFLTFCKSWNQFFGREENQKCRSLREPVLGHIMKGALEGLSYLHSEGFVHGDFKLENIVVCQDPESPIGLTGKLVDFELSCKNKETGRMFGTFIHMAPEAHPRGDGPKTIPLDLWAVGSSLFSAITAKHLRDIQNAEEATEASNKNAIQFNLTDLDALKEYGVSPDFMNLLILILRREPEERWTCDQILSSKWMSECEKYVNSFKVAIKHYLEECLTPANVQGSVSAPPELESSSETRPTRLETRTIRSETLEEFYQK